MATLVRCIFSLCKRRRITSSLIHLKFACESLGSIPCRMAPVGSSGDLSSVIENYIERNPVMIFSKSYCPYCKKVKNLFESLKLKYESLELDEIVNGAEMQRAMAAKVGRSSVPQVYINGKLIGGCDDTMAAYSSGKLQQALSSPVRDFSSEIQEYVELQKVVMFGKTNCPLTIKSKELLQSLNFDFLSVDFDKIDNGDALQHALGMRTGRTSIPQIFVSGIFLGGCDEIMEAHKNGTLSDALQLETTYDYDLIVIGGGSGGLAASKEAANLGKSVAVLDFVTPTPLGTTWGLGGTCVNVGCIPKKLMHQAALLGQALNDAKHYGWEVPEDRPNHVWSVMRQNIQDHIGSLNWGYKVQLKNSKVTYLNCFGTFVSPIKVKTVDKKGNEAYLNGRQFIIATGERPNYPDCEGAREYAITSDDLFSLENSPGKTLVIGASYVALECAGFLAGIGLDVTVMVRSILLRGFDQDMAERIGEYMKNEGIKFIRPCVPTKIEKIDDGPPQLLKVTGLRDNEQQFVDEFNTVLIATGREACTDMLGLETAGVETNPKNKKISANNERSNVHHIYAIGDVVDGKPCLTPVAIEAGVLLAQRLYGNSNVQCDYTNVPTTVFTPLEYGCIGFSEEDSIKIFGEENIEVYHSNFNPLEWTVPHRPENACYCKLICLKTENEKIIGFHYLGPNAGEITQGFGLGIKKGATKADMEALIGIHPTCAEIFTTMRVTKRSGGSTAMAGC